MNKQTLGEVVSWSRGMMNLSQRQLAKITGIDNAEISRIEKGKRVQPGYLVIKSLAKALNIDFVYLMELAGYNKEDIDDFERFENLPPFPNITWDLIHQYSKMYKDSYKLNILKVMRGYKEGVFSEAQFIKLLSDGLGINIMDLIFDEEKSTISYENNENKK